jgi:hypothetical protein
MAKTGSIEPVGRLHAILGLAEEAPAADIARAYRRLRAHVESRAQTASDAASWAGYEAELRALARAFEVRVGGEVDPGESEAGSGPRKRRLRRWAGRAGWSLLGALVLASVLFAVKHFGGGAGAPAPARVAVRTDPAGATVELLGAEDEHVAASGPADGSALSVPEGDYTLRVGHPDCPEAWQQTLALAAGELREFAPQLCQGEGRLVIRSNVSEDRALVDGLDVGQTGSEIHSLRVGAHQVEVRKQGYRPWTGKVVLRRDEEITLNAELEPEAGQGAGQSADSSTQAASAGSPAAAAAPPPPQPPPGASAPPAPQRSVTGGAGGRTAPPPRTGKGGSKSWHDAIKSGLVADYDRNGSRSLDTREEIQSIACSRWQSIEASYETGGLAVDMSHLYGFDGSSAPANTLGITPAMRGYAYDRMKQCGLKTRS